MSYANIGSLHKIISAIETQLHKISALQVKYNDKSRCIIETNYFNQNDHCTLVVNGNDWTFRIFQNDIVLTKIQFISRAIRGSNLRVYPNLIYMNGSTFGHVTIIRPTNSEEKTYCYPIPEDRYFQDSLMMELPDTDMLNFMSTFGQKLSTPDSIAFMAQCYEANTTVDFLDLVPDALETLISTVVEQIENPV